MISTAKVEIIRQLCIAVVGHEERLRGSRGFGAPTDVSPPKILMRNSHSLTAAQLAEADLEDAGLLPREDKPKDPAAELKAIVAAGKTVEEREELSALIREIKLDIIQDKSFRSL